MKKVLLLAAGVAALSVAATAAVEKAPKAVAEMAKTEALSVSQLASMQENATERTNFGINFANRPQRADESLVAKYRRPAGALYVGGITSAGSSYYNNFLNMRPYYDYTYTNQSQGAESQSWTQYYYLRNTGYTHQTVTDKNLVVSGLWGERDTIPALTVFAGSNSATYQPIPYSYSSSTKEWTERMAVQTFHNNIDSIGLEEGLGVGPRPFGASTRDKQAGVNLLTYTGATAPTNSLNSYGFWFGTNASGVNKIAVATEAPDYPYAVSGVKMFYVVGQVDQDVQLTATVYKLVTPERFDTVWVTEDSADIYLYAPVLGDVLATGTATLTATTETEVSAGGKEGYLEFPFVEKYDDGTEEEFSLDVTDALFVAVEGYNNNSAIHDFRTFITRDQVDEGFAENGYLYRVTSTREFWRGMSNFFIESLTTAPAIFLQAEWPFMMYNYTNEDGVYSAPDAGGSETVQIFADRPSDSWIFTLADGSDIPSWIEFEATDNTESGAYANTTDVKFTVAARGDAEPREAKIKITTPGAVPVYYTVKQGISGVTTVAAEESTVAVAGDNIVVNAAEAGAVAVYNVAGQQVAAAQVSEGANYIDAANFVKGVYVVKFANGKSYKVVK